MVLDCHIHTAKDPDSQEEFIRKLNAAGVDGGIVFSLSPPSFHNQKRTSGYAEQRLKQVMTFTQGNHNLYPFFFIDPLEEDAGEQVDMACEAGIRGFKVICCHHYPQDDRAMKIWDRIAKRNKPILFHSGILYNNGPSSEYNRPGNFEHLFYIPGLRFAMAHISWPWVDELIAVFGKWNSSFEDGRSINPAELFVDLTPGTPPIYREEALTKLLTVGYLKLPDHMIFGTDGNNVYNSERYRGIIEADHAIYDKLNVSPLIRDKIFHQNILSFIHGKDRAE